MANRFWVAGGNGNWNDTSNWSATTGGASGASVPGSTDAAMFDASSGSGTATLDISPTIQTLTMTGFTGTLAFGTNTITLNSTGSVFTGATTYSVTGTPRIILSNATATSRSITAGSVTEANSISFDIQAGSGSVGVSGNVRDLVFSGTFTGSIGNNTRTIFGNLTLKSGMTTAGGTSVTTFAATSGVKTITSAGITYDYPVTFNGAGGTWEMQDNLTLGATRALTVTAGTLDLNTFQASASSLTATGTTARGISDGTIVLVGSGATILGASDLTNMTIGGTVSINATYSGGTGTRTLNWGSTTGGSEARAVNLNVTAGTDTLAISGQYKAMNFTGFAGTLGNNNRTLYGSLTLTAGMTITAGASTTIFGATSGTSTITTAGKTIDFPLAFDGAGGTFTFAGALTQGSTRAFTLTAGTVRLKEGVTSTVGSLISTSATTKYLQSASAGSQATLSQASGTVNAQNTVIRDIAATGGATFNALLTNGNQNAGNNSGWEFGAAGGGAAMALTLGLSL